jgi:23S rRNA pseudouridine955/2504/2580 synthase/23S rRNA pseudouridine1911/1915/1917 synthase
VKRRPRVIIASRDGGQKLIDFLVRRFTYHDRDAWNANLAQGRVLVNGAPGLPDTVLRRDDEVEYKVPDLPEPPVPTDVPVLIEDERLLAVNKPAMLPCHPGGRFFANTLWSQLRQRHGYPFLSLIHRLDRETSGVILLAKTPEAEKSLRTQFARRLVEKVYWVIIEGEFPDHLDAAGWLEPDPASPVRKKRQFRPGTPEEQAAAAAGPTPAKAKTQTKADDDLADANTAAKPDWAAVVWAETRFRLLRRANGLSLVEARPHTGRLHQIRATLCSLGFPVTGDKLYGLDANFFLRFREGLLTDEDQLRLRLSRQALHAARLRCRNPQYGQELIIEAPMPPEMAALLD